MFTGIIEKAVPVHAVRKEGRDLSVSIGKPAVWKLAKGESIAIDGVCSTVVGSTRSSFRILFMPETLRKTTVGSFAKGQRVNLERSLVYGNRVHGHFVQGHIDGAVPVVSVVKDARGYFLTLRIPKKLQSFVTARGSLAVNGVSLTVATYARGRATVALIPYTLRHTNLGMLRKGDLVNIETDILAQYGKNALHGRVSGHAKNALRKSR